MCKSCMTDIIGTMGDVILILKAAHHSIIPCVKCCLMGSQHRMITGCKVHNSHCCICSGGISPYYSIYNRSLVGFCGCFTSYIVIS